MKYRVKRKRKREYILCKALREAIWDYRAEGKSPTSEMVCETVKFITSMGINQVKLTQKYLHVYLNKPGLLIGEKGHQVTYIEKHLKDKGVLNAFQSIYVHETHLKSTPTSFAMGLAYIWEDV